MRSAAYLASGSPVDFEVPVFGQVLSLGQRPIGSGLAHPSAAFEPAGGDEPSGTTPNRLMNPRMES